ncbi:hypothetical protein BDR04DRAFT_1131201 [Suillus decipiens]|nr:hypothetical protein BDR04DRAFT_1131201 [Suillus decipiens]
MHIAGNLSDLNISLWHGTMDCGLSDDVDSWDWALYTFGLGPTLLYGVLPQPYWLNYCKLVRGFQLLYLWHAHFIQPCIHQVNHLAPETLRKGPLICYAQWTMERMIGNLGQEIRQPSNPYANLSQEGLRRCQLDEPPKGLPTSSVDLGDGYALLWKYPEHAEVIARFLGEGRVLHCIKKWAHLLLPNGQIARSAWRETIKPLEKICISWNVKVHL